MNTTPTDQRLQQLILNRKSDRPYERLSRDCGGEPRRNAIQKLVKSEMKSFPDKETIEGLCGGLPATVHEVLTASAISLDLLLPSTRSNELVLNGAGALPALTQSLLHEMSEELQRAYREGTDRGHKDDEELEPRTKARSQEPAQPSPMNHAEVSPAHEDDMLRTSIEERRKRILADVDTVPPIPDEYALAAYDAPSEGRALRQQQDADAERGDGTTDWEGA